MTPQDFLTDTEAETPDNPFPGLRPFEFGESHLYFGRDGQSDQLIRKLSATRFVAVVGTSGSGKSSLVRAGLLPDLFSGYMSHAGSHWRVALMRPSNDPLGNLAAALNSTGVFGSDIAENAQIQTAITEATLRRGSLGLVEVVRHNRMPSNESLLVVVDQFEELFRFARVSGSEQYRYEAAAFVKLLLDASAQREHAVYVVLTMRSDFLGDCSMFWDLPEAINEGQYLIPRLTRDQRMEAIAGPVAVCGGDITQRLVNRLLNDMGDNPDQLPILQHALMRTWENWKADHAEGEGLDLRHYEAIGGMGEALSRHADEAWGELPDERARLVAEKVFKALTEKGEDNREVRRPVELKTLCELTGAEEPEVISVVDVFRRTGRSFLMPPAAVPLEADSLVDISHESLIRNWERLKAWVDEESVSAQIYRRLAETAVLHAEGRAGLWRDPDLQIALDWRERARPNAAWAARYHPAFDAAMKFLDESVEARDAEAREAEVRRRREVRRARVVAVVFFFLFMLSLVAVGVAYSQTLQARAAFEHLQEANRQTNAARANAEQSAATARRAAENERAAKQTEAEQRLKAEQAESVAVNKQKEAEAAKADAVRQAEIARTNERLAETAKAEAETQRATAVTAAEKNRQFLYAADINLAQQAYEANNIARGRALLEAHKPGGPDAPGFDWHYLWRLLHQESDTLLSPGGEVSAIALSGDGKTLAVTASENVALWDTTSRKSPVWVKYRVGMINSLALSPDKKLVVAGGVQNSIKLMDGETGLEVGALEGHTDAVNAVAFSPDGALLATGSNDHTTRLWDVASRQEVARLEGNSYVRSVAFSPDGKEVAVGGVDGAMTRWRNPSTPEASKNQWATSVVSFAYSPNGMELVTANTDGVVELRHCCQVNSAPLTFTSTDKKAVTSVAFLPDGEMLAVGYSDGTLKLLAALREAPRGRLEELITLKGHQDSVKSLAVAPDGTLVTGSADWTVKFWDSKAQVLEQSPFQGHKSEVWAVAFSPDGRLIASGDGNKTVRLWRADTRAEVCSLKGSAGAIRSLAFSPDGRVLATGSEVKTGEKDKPTAQRDAVALWDAGTCAQLASLGVHAKFITSVAFSPDGRLLATAGRDNAVRLWDANAFKEVRALEGFTVAVIAVAFSPDGRVLATGEGDGRVRLWDVASAKELSDITVGVWGIYSLAFSPALPGQPGRRLLAAGTKEGNVNVWDVSTMQVKNVAILRGHRQDVASIAFSPDGRMLASGSFDSTVKLWSTESFKELITLKGHDEAVNAVAFSRDGRVLATGSFDKTVRLWRAATDEEVKAASGKDFSARQ